MELKEQYEKYFDGNIDIYRICRLYNINDPALYHGVKKILRLGSGDKSKEQDIKEAIACLERWLEMEEEEKESNSSDLKEAMERDDMSGRAKSIRDRMTKFSTTKINKMLKRLGEVFNFHTMNVPHITPGIGSEKLDNFISNLDYDQIDYLDAIVHDYESETEEKVESKADQYLNSLIDDLMKMSQPEYQEFIYRVVDMNLPAPPHVRLMNKSEVKKWLLNIQGEIDKIRGVADKVMDQEYDDYIISLANDLMGISKKSYQSAFHEINEEVDSPIPSMRDRNYKNLKEWASELEGDELTKVAQTIDIHKIETF